MRRVINELRPVVSAHPKACPQLKGMIEEAEKWLSVDPFALIHQMTFTSQRPYKQYTFFRRHPLYCGLWIHHARVLYHKHGVTYAAVPGGVMYTTQMYHALHQEKLLDLKWSELESLWRMQGNSAYFIGEPLTTVEGYWRNYTMTMGML